LPLNSNHKLDRERLPAPHGARTNLESQYVSPRDVTELRLMQIWEELLDVRPIGVGDSFFDLGGHSLLALRLLVKIEQTLGRKVPLAALLRNPTIAHLAAVIRRPDDVQPQLVPLWAAKHRQALFLVHTGGGTVLNYVPLVRHLAPPLPVYGLQARGLDGHGEPHRDMAEMAADYMAKIRAVQPEGPYLLAGHSFGGLVAFEIARQMLTARHAVALLAMFDSALWRPADDAVVDLGSGDAEARMLADAVAGIGRFVGRQIDLSAEALRDLSPDAQMKRALEALRSCEEIPVEESARMMRNLLDIGKAHLAARAAYHPKPAPLSIVLFRARDARTDDAAADSDAVGRETLGWSRVSTAPVQVVWVPGDHVTMMSEPNVRGLAATLQPLLAAAVQLD
jgi:thioesterase domain-containing protein/acyl carrier protein